MDKILAQLSLLIFQPLFARAAQCRGMRQFGALLNRVVPIKSNIIALLLNAITPAFTDINTDLTDEHFPSVEGPNPDGGELKHYDRNVSTDDVLADLKSRSRRAATAAESLRYWLEHPECRKFWIAALGQVWNNQVLVLIAHGSDRLAHLSHIALPWDRGFRFLSFPL